MTTADHPRPSRVVVAPDSFKGSARAADVAAAIARGIRSTGAEVVELPFADGGEGTLEAIVDAWGARVETIATTDAIGRPTTARYAISPDGATGIIETADANGLPQVSDVALRPRDATTRGIAPIVQALMDAGAQEIVLFIGGSATTDGGAGLLAGLGASLQNADGREIGDGGAALANLARIDLSGLDPRVRRLRWRVACDVTNPLVGDDGAAAVFGPQKGADAADVSLLDAALDHWAELLADATGTDVRRMPGAGAAGGLAAPLVAVLGATLEPGWKVVADAVGAARILADADLVITGEGRLDASSLGGKVVSGIRTMTPDDIPIVVVAGAIALDDDALAAAGFTAAFALARGPAELDELRRTVLDDLTALSRSLGRLWAAIPSRTPLGKGATRP